MHKNLKQFTKTTRRFTIALALVITGTAWAQESGTTAAPSAKPFDVKSTFRNICGFCPPFLELEGGAEPPAFLCELGDRRRELSYSYR